MKPTTLLLSCLMLISMACRQGTKAVVEETPMTDYLSTETTEQFNERMQWWRDARFGMFIHWGPYAVPAGEYKGKTTEGIGEWIMDHSQIPVAEYETFAKQFNPVAFNADTWVKIAKDAGMKYIVITSKHHDGFSLWNSKVSTYDFMDFTEFKRDPIQELKEACDREGIKLCFYHSIMDWHHPDAQAPHYPDYNTDAKTNPNFGNYVTTYLKPQVKELVETYQPAVMWFDGEWIPEWTEPQGKELYNYIRNMKPDIIINNRVGKGRQGMQGMNKSDDKYAGDFGTPEQEILEGTSSFDWESCMTMNDTWGYKAADSNWKSAETLIHNLIDIAAKGGNYLLNVGPTAEGLIPQPSVERLAEIGEWMKINHEAIYGARIWYEYKDGDKIRYTQPQGSVFIYAISLGWPGKSITLHHVVPQDNSEIHLLGYEKALKWKKNKDNSITIETPAEMKSATERPCKYAYAFRIKV